MRLFIDSSAFVAKHNKNDINHKRTIETFQKILGSEIPVTRMYTSAYVLSEAVTVALVRSSHKNAVELGEAILNSRAIEVLGVDEEIFKDAWKIFKTYKDSGFSFTDCTSFALMKRTGIKHVFTFDKHFDSMGFLRIL